MKAAIVSVLCICVFTTTASVAKVRRAAYSTHLTGVSLQSIAADRSGNVYVTGYGTSPGIFVAKLNPSGKVVYSEYIGTTGSGSSIAVDWNGNAYVTGSTSGGLPTTAHVFQPNLGDDPFCGSSDAFVIKLNSQGKLDYATYLGGQCIDSGAGIAVDFQGNAYVTGLTTGEFPTTPNAINNNAICAEFCGFVAKIDSKARSLVYSDYLGTFDVNPRAIALDLFGHAYVTGTTNTNFITTPNAFEPNWPGGLEQFEPFVAKLNLNGNSLAYGTYLGGEVCNLCGGFGQGESIAVNLLGEAYTVGVTIDGFPTTPHSVQPTFGGQTDGFVAKLNAAGNSLDYSTYIGGADPDSATDVAVDLLGNAYVLWGTSGADQHLAKLNPNGTALTDLGDVGPQAVKIAADFFGNVYVATTDGAVIKIAGF